MQFSAKTTMGADQVTHMFQLPILMQDGTAEAACTECLELDQLSLLPIRGATLCTTCLVRAGEQMIDNSMAGLLT